MITHSPLKLSSHDLFHMGRRDGLIPLSGRLNPLTRREAGSNPSHPFTKAPEDLRYLFLPLAYAKVQRGCLYRP
jgi:hypothetical protein